MVLGSVGSGRRRTTTSSTLCQRFRCNLQGYVDHTLPSLLCITMILRVRRKFFEIITFPNRGLGIQTCVVAATRMARKR